MTPLHIAAPRPTAFFLKQPPPFTTEFPEIRIPRNAHSAFIPSHTRIAATCNPSDSLAFFRLAHTRLRRIKPGVPMELSRPLRHDETTQTVGGLFRVLGPGLRTRRRIDGVHPPQFIGETEGVALKIKSPRKRLIRHSRGPATQRHPDQPQQQNPHPAMDPWNHSGSATPTIPVQQHACGER